jgi:3-oxoacyl-[acyl-carrier protein] reductase
LNVLVTGAASGIGRKTAELLVRAGHQVLAADFDRVGLASAARELGWSEPQVLIRPHDVRDAVSWSAVVGDLVSTWGRLDALLNVAGVIRPEFVCELTADHVALQFDVNAKGVVLGTHAAAAVMALQGGGHIVNIASTAGLAPIPGISVYCASKFAVRGFSLAAAAELGPKGVAVTCVHPDATDTPMLDYQTSFEAAAMTFSTPRPLPVEDVARTIVDVVLVKKPLEIDIPRSRGRLARISMHLPTFVTRALLRKMTRKGLAAQRAAVARRTRTGLSVQQD